MKKKPKRDRPALVPISDEVRAWCGALESELVTWPQVVSKPMFGMLGLYREARIFAGLPRTRSFGSDCLIFKLHNASPALRTRAQRDQRISINPMAKSGWITYHLHSQSDLRGALEWLQEAWEDAALPKRRASRKK